MKAITAGLIVAGLLVTTHAHAEPRPDDHYQPRRIHAEPLRGDTGYTRIRNAGHAEERLSGAGYRNARKPDAPAAGYSAGRTDRTTNNRTTAIVNDPARYADRDRGYYRADGVTYNDYRKRSKVVVGTSLGYGYSSYRNNWYSGYRFGYGYPYRYQSYRCYRPYRYGCYPRYHGGWYSGVNVGYRHRFGSHGRSGVGFGVSFGY